MSGSSFGKLFKITTWGESHGKGVGVVIDGCPAGLSLSENDIQKFLDIRKPGQNEFTTLRNEDDKVEILSGIFEGKTTGTPISLIVYNKDHHSTDYGNIASCYRPGHADYTYDEKYGFRDYRGGGRSSGRETLARVAGGAVAQKVLSELGITVDAEVTEIAGIDVTTEAGREAAEEKVLEVKEEQDSVGGVVTCFVNNMPTGIGEPVFDKLDARLSQAVMSIGAVKAVEIGDGVKASKSRGSEDNDGFEAVLLPDEEPDSAEDDEDPYQDGGYEAFEVTSNHAGGILGGMSDGAEIVIRAYFKPTPSIAKPQKTANENGDNITLSIKGRHDPIIVPRAVVVVETMAAITILDALLSNMTAKLDRIIEFYK